MSKGLASDVLAACASAGVREFCVCAGARNVELVVALERSGGCRLWHFYDERSAAFFALGRTMKSGRPVAVVTTSGTAVAELLPATVEAYYQSLPLVLLTADRPVRFRESGAPQAIEQVGMMGRYAFCWDVVEDAAEAGEILGEALRIGRPAHLNICFEEPRAEDLAALHGVHFSAEAASTGPPRDDQGQALLEFLDDGRDGLMVLLGN